MNEKSTDKINEARIQVFLLEPFLGYLMQHFNIVINDECPTAATNGRTIQFGKQFLEKLTMSDTIFVLLHELLHIILGHPARMRGKEPIRFNVACDIIVNDIILEYGYYPQSFHYLSGSTYRINSLTMSAEEVYNAIQSFPIPKIEIFRHYWHTCNDEEAIEMSDLIRITREAHSKGFHINSRNLKSRIAEVTYGISRLSWNRILMKFLHKLVYDYSFDRIDNRYHNVLIPQYHECYDKLTMVWFLIDVSHSIDEVEFNQFSNELVEIAQRFPSLDCELSFFSGITTKPCKFRNQSQLNKAVEEMKTSGGTDFSQIFESMDLFFGSTLPNLVVIFTDGHGNFMDCKLPRPVSVIWCITDAQINPPFGSTIYL